MTSQVRQQRRGSVEKPYTCCGNITKFLEITIVVAMIASATIYSAYNFTDSRSSVLGSPAYNTTDTDSKSSVVVSQACFTFSKFLLGELGCFIGCFIFRFAQNLYSLLLHDRNKQIKFNGCLLLVFKKTVFSSCLMIFLMFLGSGISFTSLTLMSSSCFTSQDKWKKIVVLGYVWGVVSVIAMLLLMLKQYCRSKKKTKQDIP